MWSFKRTEEVIGEMSCDLLTWKKKKIYLNWLMQDFIICIEMFLAAIAHHYTFTYKPYVQVSIYQSIYQAIHRCITLSINVCLSSFLLFVHPLHLGSRGGIMFRQFSGHVGFLWHQSWCHRAGPPCWWASQSETCLLLFNLNWSLLIVHVLI